MRRLKRGLIFLMFLVLCVHHNTLAESARSGDPASSSTHSPEVPPEFKKVYESSFEDVSKKDDHRLTWDFPHWFEFAAMHKEGGGSGDGEGGARMWVETNRSRTGKTSIGLELFDIGKSRRAEFVVFPEKYVRDEYYASYWLFLPKEWGLFDDSIDWDWYEIGNPYSTAGAPYSAIHIKNPDKNQEVFDVVLSGREQDGKQFNASEKRMVVPKDRWFNVLFYVRRDKTNGVVRLWFDGQYIGERSAFPTRHSSKEKFGMSIAKVYYSRGDKVPHRIWIDDFILYARKQDSEPDAPADAGKPRR